MIAGPGEYLSVSTQLLGTILTSVTRKPVAELLAERIWKPMGAQRPATWNLDREGGVEKSLCCLNATALDYARLGQLVLDDGKVDGRQIVPSAWIERIATPAALPVSD
jgi:CubicO group peptidase (beta-lactamase class C family)